MSIDARLNKLMPALTAKERAVLILRSWKEGVEEDPLWRSTMPRDQSSEFNRLISLMNVCNVNVGFLIIFLDEQVQKLELRLMWAGSLALAAEYSRPKKSKRGEWLERVMDVLPLRLEEAVVEQAPKTWNGVRSIEIVLDELAAEFDGEHPLRPHHAKSIARAKKGLLDLRETPGFDLPEPSAEDLADLRARIAGWARL